MRSNYSSIEKFEYCVALMVGFIPRIDWLPENERPTADEIREWFKACTTTRGGFRLIRRPRKGASETVCAVFERLRWHQCIPGGSYTLWGPMNSLMRTDSNTYAKIDAFATMVAVLCGTYQGSADHKWSALTKSMREA